MYTPQQVSIGLMAMATVLGKAIPDLPNILEDRGITDKEDINQIERIFGLAIEEYLKRALEIMKQLTPEVESCDNDA
jgi:hypothetical protein